MQDIRGVWDAYTLDEKNYFVLPTYHPSPLAMKSKERLETFREDVENFFLTEPQVKRKKQKTLFEYK